MFMVFKREGERKSERERERERALEAYTHSNTDKGYTRDAGPGFSYFCRKHFLLTNNETRISGFF